MAMIRRQARPCKEILMSTWYEQLKDPRWQRKRLEIMQRDEFCCRVCGDSESTLNVHHGYYGKGLAPWEYGDDTLWTLCSSCHEYISDTIHDIHLELGRIDPHFMDEFFKFMLLFKKYLRRVLMRGETMVLSYGSLEFTERSEIQQSDR
jgi:hypothetical protein